MRRAAFTALVALALAAWSGAAHAQRSVAAEDYLHAANRIEWDAGGLYDGRFADGTPFQIELAYPEPAAVPKEARGQFTQAYWYPRRFTGRVLPLRAAAGRGSTLMLTVPSDDWKATSETFAIVFDRGRLEGHGTWTLARTGKSQAFTLVRSVPYRAVVVARPSAAAEAEGEARPFTFSARFPVLDDPSVNAWIHDVLATCDGDLECANWVRVSWNAGGMLALDGGNYDYSLHAAHGNTLLRTGVFLTGAGKAEQVHLDRFLDPTPACRTKASSAIVAKLRAQRVSQAGNGALKAGREPLFTPLRDGIQFSSNAYDVGSYAEGAPSVFVTRSELGDCVRNLPRWDR